jgi:hypothetical protein
MMPVATAAAEVITPKPSQPQDQSPVRRLPGHNKDGRIGAYKQAVGMQKLLIQDMLDPKTKPSVRAGIARAWDVLEERKRILRGNPLPGQFRPDLDPVQLAKALKRARSRKPFDVAMIKDAPPNKKFFETPAEDEPAEEEEAETKDASPSPT